MKRIRIASVATSEKVVYSLTNEKAFVPEHLRVLLEVGKYCLINDDMISESQKDENGEPMLDENGKVLLTGEQVKRTTVKFIGTLQECVEAQYEEEISGAADEIIVKTAKARFLQSLGMTASELSAAI